MGKSDQRYFLGLDMGTSSVGWAVTDPEYHLLRAKGKDMWGIREFEEAQGAVDRRTHRISRRRRQREQVRIGLLKSYFSEAIENIDPNFFIRLDNSKFYPEDKDSRLKGGNKNIPKKMNGIFDDENYTDKEYYEEYPTIFHLRKELLHSIKPHDVRLVYLALLNMFKHRGHFLNASLSASGAMGSRKTKEIYTELCSVLAEFLEVSLPQAVNCDEIDAILCDRNLSKTRKSEALQEFLAIPRSEKKSVAVLKGICGRSIKVSDLIDGITKEEDVSFSFADSGYEDKEPDIVSRMGEETFQVIALMKELYDNASLKEILGDHEFLSDARVSSYEKHKRDLALLKKVYRKYGTVEEYNEMFRSDDASSYSAYINSYNNGSIKRRGFKNRKSEEFYKKVKSIVSKWDAEDSDIQAILSRIETETFMPKQLTASNGVIPNQVHAKEMHQILENAERYLPFLREKDESNLTTSERIERLFTFHIPYYVGPVSENSAKHNGNGWVVRKEGGEVLPWNIEDKIDMKKTSEEFIKRLIRRCTYLEDEKVMPKGSLLYERYCVLNEINKLKIDGEPIDVSVKQNIYNTLYKRGKRVTKKSLLTYLQGQGLIKEAEQVTGVDINLNNYLGSYGKFKEIFGGDLDKDSCQEMAEDIIYWCTIFGDSKKRLREVLREKYEEQLTEQQIKRILGFKFKDWARFSKEFLLLSGCDKSTGEIVSLIRAMWDTNLNLMELLHSPDFDFGERLEEKQKKSLGTLSEFTHEDLEDMYFSAPVKRMIWQTLLLMKEIEKIKGCAPDRVFIEMTRKEDDKKERKDSRGKQLIELYKSIKDESRDWKKEIEAADEKGRLRSKKLYLYYTQMGRDMYTGKPIDLDTLFNDNLYDIDHIYPRHFVKDDNIGNNLVLVNKNDNNHKQDSYPIEAKIRSNPEVIGLWRSLRSANLITEEKYHRLTRTTEFSDEEKAGFIARQLVETSQGTKGVADLLSELLPDTKIVYAKAANVNRFRQHNKFAKSRIVNDFHHAQDAYLNIVVGNAYYVKFTQNPLNFIKESYNRDQIKNHYHLSCMFDRDIKRGEEVAWIGANKNSGPGTIATVKQVMNKNTPLLTRMNFVGHGAIANETLYGADVAKDKGYIPLKASDARMADVKKYGGFSSASTAYFFLVEHDKGKKRIRTIEKVSVYLADRIGDGIQALEKYCIDELGLRNPSVRLKKIKLQSLIKRNGYYAHITGATGDRYFVRNAVELCVNQEWVTYIKKVEKYGMEKILDDIITTDKNLELYDILKDKHRNSLYKNRPNPVGEPLNNMREKFREISIENQCLVLLQLLNLSAIGSQPANLTLIGGAVSTGKMQISKNVSDTEEFVLINQSVTGLTENRIDLLTV